MAAGTHFATSGFDPVAARLARCDQLDGFARFGNKCGDGRGEGRFRRAEKVSFWGLAQLGVSTVIFLLAAMAAKQWGLAPSLTKIL
ncbi:hypothetical protein EN875_035150, partial [Mesorhizobium sp. M2D.F.Ca.ET.232.01.1.1]